MEPALTLALMALIMIIRASAYLVAGIVINVLVTVLALLVEMELLYQVMAHAFGAAIHAKHVQKTQPMIITTIYLIALPANQTTGCPPMALATTACVTVTV